MRDGMNRREYSVSALRKAFYTVCGQITNCRASSEEVFVDVLTMLAEVSDWLDRVRMKFGGGFRNAMGASVGNMRAACSKQVPTVLERGSEEVLGGKIRQR
jgi:hypothetical protein